MSNRIIVEFRLGCIMKERTMPGCGSTWRQCGQPVLRTMR